MKTTLTIRKGMLILLGMAFLIPAMRGENKQIISSFPVKHIKINELTFANFFTDTLPSRHCRIDSLPSEALSFGERQALIYMREEEYLACDVYTTLSKLYAKPIFSNISYSESRHTDLIQSLLEKYKIEDPAANHETGKFTNPRLQFLYNKLVENGAMSLLDGLIAGATIEDLDIFDLKNYLNSIDNQDIILVFNSLMRASRNHMRAFNNNIVSMDDKYTPQYLTQDEFNTIIEGQQERGSANIK